MKGKEKRFIVPNPNLVTVLGCVPVGLQVVRLYQYVNRTWYVIFLGPSTKETFRRRDI